MALFQPDPRATQRDLADLIYDMGRFVSAQYANVEDQMIRLVASYVKRDLEAPDDVLARLTAVRRLRAEADRITRTLNETDMANRVIAIASDEGNAAAIARIGFLPGVAVSGPIPPTAAAATAQIAIDLASNLQTMRDRITRYMPDVYQRVVALSAPEVLTGASTRQATHARTIERFLAKGVTGFEDTAGRQWRIGSYADMATRTTVHRAWQESNLERVRTSTGITLATIIRGVDSCAPCARWGSKIVSTDGTPGGQYQLEHAINDGELVTVNVAGTIDQARQDGWDHPNCRCVVSAYMPGLSLPANSESTFDPQAEKDRDRQRLLERRIRDLRRQQAASLDDLETKRLDKRIRAAQAVSRQHAADTGQIRRTDRERLAFSDGKTPTAPPLPRPKAVGQ